KTSRALSFVGAMLLLALLAATGASARPPQPSGSPAPLPSFIAPPPHFAGAHLVVSRIPSPPAHARAARSYVLHRPTVNEGSAAASSSTACSSGAHSLSSFGAHVYPETGNGGYTSVHTDVYLNYDTQSNLFLPGTHVVLTDQATQCLTDFSLDFERTSPNRKD